MSQSEYFRVNVEGPQQTIIFSEQHLNSSETAVKVGQLLRDRLDEGAAECLNVDLTNIGRINSAGLNELISINSQCRSLGVRLVLIDVRDSVREIFALTRLERMFEFYSTSAV